MSQEQLKRYTVIEKTLESSMTVSVKVRPEDEIAMKGGRINVINQAL